MTDEKAMNVSSLYSKALTGNLRPVDLQPISNQAVRQAAIERTNNFTAEDDAVKVRLSKASLDYSDYSTSNALATISNEEPIATRSSGSSINIVA